TGGIATGLFAIGPLTRGRWWELTSVPDIRVQAARLAQRLATLTPQMRPVARAPATQKLRAAG
ncbi:MAG: hypothetical protein J0H99_23285, partial [Rhodospirillales bacterium]|nr:hypothetical protein [Rhodospirillales bacterium]